ENRMSPLKLQMELRQDRTMITRESVAKRIIEVVITAPTPEVASKRMPLNIALVLDRSGSMEGDKLRYVQQAACHLIDQLDAQDQVALVSFDNVTDILAPSTAVSVSQRDTLKRHVNGLHARGGTDLFSGWLHGANEAAGHQIPNGVNRVLLLTDGQANQGETRQTTLQHHAQELRQRGVSTSTFGVGADFNQYLLEGMAEHGGGHYYFIEHPNQVPSLFRQELGELMAVVARSAQLEVTIPTGTSVSLLGEVPHDSSGGCLRVPLGDFFAGEKRFYYFEVLTPTSSQAVEQIFPFELLWTDSEGVPTDVVQMATFRYATETETRAIPADTALRGRAAEIRAAVAERTSLRLVEEGKTDEAVRTLEGIVSKYGDLLGPDKVADLNRLRISMQMRTLSPGAAKASHNMSYAKRNSR
ncbi:MAG: hypothetical protein JWN14_602, partial [Chthonomonadales bacterium]|nr:hypothetical protein [Chthonomonadales bacterium]